MEYHFVDYIIRALGFLLIGLSYARYFSEMKAMNNFIIHGAVIASILIIISMVFDHMHNDYVRVITYWLGVTIFIITLLHSHFMVYTFSNLHHVTGSKSKTQNNI